MSETGKKYKILLVEDEESLAVGLEFNLTEEGYDVFWAKDGKKALEAIGENQFDLIILDVMLPYYDGFEIAEHVRTISQQLPILMLTARQDAIDKIKGLEIGVDDYLTKPFHLEEVILRIKGMLKRKEWYKESISKLQDYTFSNIRIDFNSLKLFVGKSHSKLTSQEALLLKYFIDRKGQIVSRGELLENVWHTNPDVETRTVDIFVARLRKLIEKDQEKPHFIQSVRGRGYIFDHD